MESIVPPSGLYHKLDGSESSFKHSAKIEQSDYDSVVKYIKKTFPKATSVQKDVDQVLKRTFSFGGAPTIKRKPFFNAPPRKPDIRRANKRKEPNKVIPKKLSYDSFLELNALWKAYIAELLRDSRKDEDISQRLSRADLHGANIIVSSSICSSFDGLQGIVIKETKNIFVIVTKENLTKVIPKVNKELQILLDDPHGKIILAGNSIMTRPAERASKKMKSFMEFVGAKTYRSMINYNKQDNRNK